MSSLTERLKAIYTQRTNDNVPDENGVVRRVDWSIETSDKDFDAARSSARAELARIAQAADAARKAQTSAKTMDGSAE